MSKFSPAAVLYDSAAHALKVAQDGANYVLDVAAKIAEDPSTALARLKVDSSGTLKSGLYDASGNALNITTDDARKILAAEAKIAEKSDTSLHRLTMTDAGTVKLTLYNELGSPVAFPITSPDPSLLVADFVRQSGGTDNADLRVDGSVTPVSFAFNADASDNLDLIGITFVIVANSLTFGSNNFAGLNKLTNGVQVQVTAGGSTGTLYNIVQNECFLHAASIGGFNLLIANKDVIQSSIVFGGSIRLEGGSADHLEVLVQDDLDSGIDYFKCSVQAIKGA